MRARVDAPGQYGEGRKQKRDGTAERAADRWAPELMTGQRRVFSDVAADEPTNVN